MREKRGQLPQAGIGIPAKQKLLIGFPVKIGINDTLLKSTLFVITLQGLRRAQSPQG